MTEPRPTPHLRYFIEPPRGFRGSVFKLKQWWAWEDWLGNKHGEWRGIDGRQVTDPNHTDAP